jgi:hypothetical protein
VCLKGARSTRDATAALRRCRVVRVIRFKRVSLVIKVISRLGSLACASQALGTLSLFFSRLLLKREVGRRESAGVACFQANNSLIGKETKVPWTPRSISFRESSIVATVYLSLIVNLLCRVTRQQQWFGKLHMPTPKHNGGIY